MDAETRRYIDQSTEAILARLTTLSEEVLKHAEMDAQNETVIMALIHDLDVRLKRCETCTNRKPLIPEGP